MRTAIIWLGAAVALGLLNYAIYKQEQTLAHGELIYLELAPLDPRSLMQGDYMVLNYALSRNAPEDQLNPIGGAIVIRIDENHLAHFARLDDGSPLTPDERLLHYKNRRGARFGIETFFFQEGLAQDYADARYAVVSLSTDGSARLRDLVKTLPITTERIQGH